MTRSQNPYPPHAVPSRAKHLLPALLILLCLRELPAAAQSGPVIWSSPTNLSNSPQASAHSAIVADDYGFVHVFWSEEVGGSPFTLDNQLGNTGNSIFYTRWNGRSWSVPLDVLYVPGEARAEWPVVTIDAENRLHVLWESTSSLYYSSAPSWQADSAQNWTEPLALTANSASAPWGASITADAQGTLHVVYTATGGEQGLNYTRSTDGGESWELPLRLYGPLTPSERPPSMIQITPDDAGRLHVVWQTNQEAAIGHGVFYAHSIDGGDTWAAPVQLAYRDPEDFSVGTPYLMANGASELHLIYVDGSYTGSKGRFHRISNDGGATWSEPRHIITELVGINGPVMPILDSAGQMHLIANMRTEATQVVGIYYARWQETGWPPVEPVDVSVPQIHYVAAAVRLGNELHLTYTGIETAEVWHISGLVHGVDPQPALATPPPVLPTQPARAIEAALPTATPHPETPASPSSDDTSPIQTTPVAIHPLVPAVALALMVVAGVIAWTRIRSR